MGSLPVVALYPVREVLSQVRNWASLAQTIIYPHQPIEAGQVAVMRQWLEVLDRADVLALGVNEEAPQVCALLSMGLAVAQYPKKCVIYCRHPSAQLLFAAAGLAVFTEAGVFSAAVKEKIRCVKSSMSASALGR